MGPAMKRSASGVCICPRALTTSARTARCSTASGDPATGPGVHLFLQANILQLTDDAVDFASLEQEGHPLGWHCPFSRRPQDQNLF